jgi:YidC/Oxa1 family membrane protein insertase
VAVILLTAFVRLLVMPLYLMSYKSMNKMKVIQPQIQSLRERFKDDPTRLNQEMMTLMRSNKVNPVGGCLPMLLQFPVFIALYQVLAQSIELYQAPFGGWIHDLSLKDPYYVFPALMGVSMFVQQKITPTTLDPVQAKVMMFMPLIFIFFMINLPSGLAIYMFVSALLGITQQFVFMRQNQTAPVAVKK